MPRYRYAGRSLAASACAAVLAISASGGIPCGSVASNNQLSLSHSTIESARDNFHSTALQIRSTALAVLDYSSSFGLAMLDVGKSVGSGVAVAASQSAGRSLVVRNDSDDTPTYYSFVAAAVAISMWTAAAWLVLGSNTDVDKFEQSKQSSELFRREDSKDSVNFFAGMEAEDNNVDVLSEAVTPTHIGLELRLPSQTLPEHAKDLVAPPSSQPVARRMWRTCVHCDELFNLCCLDGDLSGLEETEHLHRLGGQWSAVAHGICDNCTGSFSIFDHTFEEAASVGVVPGLRRAVASPADELVDD